MSEVTPGLEVQHEPASDGFTWEPYTSGRGAVLRVRDTSCCGVYDLASEGGQYLILRKDGKEGYEETARGVHANAVAAYIALVQKHLQTHKGASLSDTAGDSSPQ
ncbi:hypothetical protein [Nonomuraea sp. B19D2]|uniref:hypothetical protein n=1 Tax=Nonomuraea sp. B19D2 TaxID=3159561 RepID=UPI0032DA189F